MSDTPSEANDCMKLLDAGCFVFLDSDPKPFFVYPDESGRGWVYYWHEGAREFVSLSPITKRQVIEYRERALPREQAELYFRRRSFTGGSHE